METGLGIDGRLVLSDTEHADIAAEAALLGYTSLWTPARDDDDPFAVCARWHAASGLETGISVLPVQRWSAAQLIAATKKTRERTAGRFTLGVGAGTVRDAPIRTMRDLASALRPSLGDGRIYLGALGPQMLRLSAERSLGAHPYFAPVEHTTIARGLMGPEALLAVEQAAIVSADREKVLAAAKRHTKFYLALENYSNNLRRLGWGDADLADAGSERLMDAIVASGDASAIAARVSAQHAAGADHVCLQVLGGDSLVQLRAIAQLLL